MEASKIRPIGTIQRLDEQGYIINNLSLDNLQAEYKAPLDEVIHLAKDRLGDKLHSVYIRGSVAKGTAIPEIADLDTLLLVNQKPSDEGYKEMHTAKSVINEKYDFLNGIELPFYTTERLQQNLKVQFLFKTQCLCVYGTDIRLELPSFKLDHNAFAHAFNLAKDLEGSNTWLLENEKEEDIRMFCAWIMKRYVRIGFELVMMREQYFTRDLYPCYAGFIKHYPEHQEAMHRTLELAVFPIANKETIREVMDSLQDFLLTETEKLRKQYV